MFIPEFEKLTKEMNDKLADPDQKLTEESGSHISAEMALCIPRTGSRQILPETSRRIQGWLCPHQVRDGFRHGGCVHFKSRMVSGMVAVSTGGCVHTRADGSAWWRCPQSGCVHIDAVMNSCMAAVSTGWLCPHQRTNNCEAMPFGCSRTMSSDRKPNTQGEEM